MAGWPEPGLKLRGASMTKAADAFRTISEVADDLGIPKHVLRFWEVKFAQIRPMKRGGGRRYYRPEDMELLKGIRQLLHREGYTIKGVQKILREQGVESVKRFALDPRAPGLAETGEAAPRPEPKADARRLAARAPAGLPVRQNSTRSRVLATALAELEACRAILREQPVPATAAGQRRAGGER